MRTETKQANEHNKKQDNVGDEDHDNVELRTVDVACRAGAFHRCPCRTELRIRISPKCS